MARQPKINQNGPLDLARSQTSDIIECLEYLFTCLTRLNQKKTLRPMLEANSITTIITKD